MEENFKDHDPSSIIYTHARIHDSPPILRVWSKNGNRQDSLPICPKCKTMFYTPNRYALVICSNCSHEYYTVDTWQHKLLNSIGKYKYSKHINIKTRGL